MTAKKKKREIEKSYHMYASVSLINVQYINENLYKCEYPSISPLIKFVVKLPIQYLD